MVVRLIIDETGIVEEVGICLGLVDPGGQQITGQFVKLVEHIDSICMVICCRAAYLIRRSGILIGVADPAVASSGLFQRCGLLAQ